MSKKGGINLFQTTRVARNAKSETKYTYLFATLALITLALGGFIAMIIWEDTTNDKLKRVDGNIVAIQAEINSEKYVELRKNIYELNKKSELIVPIVENRADLVTIITAARKEVPAGVKIDNISLAADKKSKGNMLIISGISIDFRTIGKMMQQFTDSEDFSDFEVASINRVDKESNLIGGVRFQFELRLKQKVLKPKSTTPLI